MGDMNRNVLILYGLFSIKLFCGRMNVGLVFKLGIYLTRDTSFMEKSMESAHCGFIVL